MTPVQMYSTEFCPFCDRARRLLERKGVVYDEIRVDLDPDMRNEMRERSGSGSVPQIFIGERHVGGFEEMVELDIDDELDPLLGIDV